VDPSRAANAGFEDRLDVEPFWGIDRLTSGEIDAGFAGSVYVMWDSGNTPPPVENVPPGSTRFNKPDVKPDPHSEPRAQASARAQKYAFFGGSFLDVCSASPCLAPFR